MEAKIAVQSFSFNELLPGSIRNDQKFKAASQCLDSIFAKFNERMRELLIYSRIDEQDEQTLDDIAWGWSISYDNGYALLETIEEKREIVKNIILLHKHKGTRWSLEQITGILNIPMTIVEWWENLEYGTDLEPYEFDIFVDSGTRQLTESFYPDVIRLVNSLKNARSHLRRIQATINIHKSVYINSACMIAEIENAYPEFTKLIEANASLSIGCAHVIAETENAYPELAKLVEARFFFNTGRGCYEYDSIDVFPDLQ